MIHVLKRRRAHEISPDWQAQSWEYGMFYWVTNRGALVSSLRGGSGFFGVADLSVHLSPSFRSQVELDSR